MRLSPYLQALLVPTHTHTFLTCRGSKYYPGSMDRASPWSRFVGEMNRASRALGLADTRFGNPHGMMHERHRSTAWDMAVLAFHAMRDPVLQGIAATRRHAVTLETVRAEPPTLAGSRLTSLPPCPSGPAAAAVGAGQWGGGV